MIQVIRASMKSKFLKQGHCYQIYEVQWVAFAFLNLFPHLADSSIRSLAAWTDTNTVVSFICGVR